MNENTGKNRIIAFPFAFISGMSTGMNIDHSAVTQTYWKNIVVSAGSAKHYNPGCTVAVVTNFVEAEIPAEILSALKLHRVEIITVPFDRFRFKAEYTWALAFYKLCTLSHLADKGYDMICCMDIDVYIQASLDNAWEECSAHMLLYDINHGLGAEHYRQFCEEVQAFSGGEKKYITHYGGEFFMGNAGDAREFLRHAEDIYQKMIETDFVTTKGDEFILSLSAERMKVRVKNAGAYVFRFWTGVETHIVTTCYRFNPVSVLHLPVEKNRGLSALYERYFKNGVVPKNQVVYRKCHISHSALSDRLKRRYLYEKRARRISST